ncbi:MAG TPA: hypothetical protein VM618_11740 [Acidimicrobiia bacterium]|nr:hypothetical protein [Acidimicrobiia bacterium]
MQWDAERGAERTKQRDRLLAQYVRHELAAYSSYWRREFMRRGVEPRSVRGLADLGQVEPLEWAAVAADPGAFLLRPDEGDIARHGDRRLVLAVTWAKLRRSTDRLNREVVEPRYKPVHWHLDHGVPIGSTESDLDRLGQAGARIFSLAGLSRSDVLVGVGDDTEGLAWWQVAHGARVAHLSAVHLGPAADPELVAAARPTALAGDRASLLGVLQRLAAAEVVLDDLHTVLVAGELPTAGQRDELAAAAEAVAGRPEGVAVVVMWGPRGARAMWGECREGSAFHTFPDMEIVEVDAGERRPREEGAGELLWSSLGWHGTAVFRVRTGVTAAVKDGRCKACGRTGPMVSVGERPAAGLHTRVLAGHDEVSAFQVELRRVNGHEETIVFLALRPGADLGEVLSDLEGDLRATQYVLLRKREVEAKVKEAGARVLDRR